jgi:hypothetical protein
MSVREVALVPGSSDDELVVLGDRSAVQTAVDSVLSQAKDVGARVSVQSLADVSAGVSSLAAIGATSGTVLRLTDESAALVKKYGSIKDQAGNFHTFVREHGKIAHQLRFTQSSLAPEQLLSLQAAAATLALRAAIKNVQEAVERVEGKVDDILRMARAERVGDVLGQRTTLLHVREQMDADGMSEADWQSVAPMLASIQTTIETLRSFIASSIQDLPRDEGPGERRESLQRLLTKQLFAEALALLAIAEDNLTVWHELKLARVREAEPERLAATLRGSNAMLSRNRAADRELAETFVVALTDYGRLSTFEAPWMMYAKALRRSVASAEEEFNRFAGCRDLEEVSVQTGVNATLSEAAKASGQLAAGAGRAVLDYGSEAGERAWGSTKTGSSRGGAALRGMWRKVRDDDGPPESEGGNEPEVEK